MELFADWETRSKLDIGEVGVQRYVEDLSTHPLMLAYGPRKAPKQWILDLTAYSAGIIPACPEDLLNFINDSRVEFHAHNAAFEIAVWSEICSKRWGWPAVPLDRWYCTAAKGSAANQPRKLDLLVKRLGLPDEFHKDAKGKELIKLLSMPQKATKVYLKPMKGPDGKSVKDPAKPSRILKEVCKTSVQYLEESGVELFDGPCPGAKYFFRNDPDLMREFQEYNVQDIVAEAAADNRLPDLPADERETWLLDQRINQRGIPIDVDLCRGALNIYHDEVATAEEELTDLTGGRVTRCTQRERLVEWINERINFGSCLDAEIVDNFLEIYEDPQQWPTAGTHPHLDPNEAVPQVLKALEIRKRAGGTAVAKYQAAVDYVSPDGRCRQQLLYYGAATGRWTGRGIQPHNFKRESTPDETFIDALKTGDFGLVKLLCDLEGLTVFKLLKKGLRGIIRAPKGRKMVVSDFAGIESRVLHWLVGNEKKLEQFRKREDTYIHAAVDIYQIPFHDLAEWSDKEKKYVIRKEHKDKRQIGKACELGLGYGMGSDTFQANAAKAKSFLSSEFSAEVVAKWRAANPQVPDFWYRIESACKRVVYGRGRTPRPVVRSEKLKIYYDPRNYLCIELPSGRILYYYDPVIQDRKLYYRDGSKQGMAENYGRIDTYGGKLTENIVQAIARDLLVNSMKIIDRAGLDIIFHVHDESVTEVDENDQEALPTVHAAMTSLPAWANGLPLEAETHEVRRYTK